MPAATTTPTSEPQKTADAKDGKQLLALLALEHADELPHPYRLLVYEQAAADLEGTLQGDVARRAAFHLRSADLLQTELHLPPLTTGH
jgi:hypothetical protein